MNGGIFRGSNSSIFFFASFPNGSQLLKKRIGSMLEPILSFKSRLPLGRVTLYKKQTDSHTKKTLLCANGEKHGRVAILVMGQRFEQYIQIDTTLAFSDPRYHKK